MGDIVPFWPQRGCFFTCTHNLRDQSLSPPMTHPVGFPSGNRAAMLTMRNQALNVFYCTILRRNKPGDYTENGKESPRNYHETKQKYYSTGGDNIKRFSTLLQQTKFCSLHLLTEVYEHWCAVCGDGVTIITWTGKSLIQQFADIEGANGNSLHWGKGVTAVPAGVSPLAWSASSQSSLKQVEASIRGHGLPYFIVKTSVISKAKKWGSFA